ncbi:MAG TPA: hypothetical protein DCY20_02425, partial [Firmicutes bacterium]|nr:hypothetical protein [Bacillota bacterium]
IFLKAQDIIINMFISIAITTIASFINPILGVIVALFFLFRRISFFYENWRGIVAGVVVYAFPYCFTSMFETIAYDLRTTPLTDLGIVCILSALFLHLILRWLYKHGYTHKKAIVSMTLAPLIILLFLIPFLLKAASLFDDLLVATAADFDHDYDVDVDGINPETHVVEGHYRTLPSGEEIFIESHIRTNPNATITDNISYRG